MKTKKNKKWPIEVLRGSFVYFDRAGSPDPFDFLWVNKNGSVSALQEMQTGEIIEEVRITKAAILGIIEVYKKEGLI